MSIDIGLLALGGGGVGGSTPPGRKMYSSCRLYNPCVPYCVSWSHNHLYHHHRHQRLTSSENNRVFLSSNNYGFYCPPAVNNSYPFFQTFPNDVVSRPSLRCSSITSIGVEEELFHHHRFQYIYCRIFYRQASFIPLPPLSASTWPLWRRPQSSRRSMGDDYDVNHNYLRNCNPVFFFLFLLLL